MLSEKVIETMMLMAQMYRIEMEPAGAEMLAMDLASYPEQVILGALQRCRRELRFFPTLADILTRIEDGRPGPEEAWAMLPKDEYSSSAWTEEMREAYSACRPLLMAGDEIAARMAFKEKYTEELTKARSLGVPPKWDATLGLDKHQREAAMLDAIHKGRLLPQSVEKLIGYVPAPPAHKNAMAALPGPAETESTQASEVITSLADIIAKIKANGLQTTG